VIRAELILLKIKPKDLGYWCFSSHRVGNPGVFRWAVHEAHVEEIRERYRQAFHRKA
jgi:hypothetical protein